MDIGFDLLRRQPLSIQAFRPNVIFTENYYFLKTMFYLRSQLPTKLLGMVANLPLIGNDQLRKAAKDLTLVNSKLNDMYELF
jgi:Male sterility protein